MLGFVVGLALMMPGHVLGATGAGDVKLMAAVGAIVGPALVVTAFRSRRSPAELAVVVAARRRRLSATLAGTGRLVAGSADARASAQRAGGEQVRAWASHRRRQHPRRSGRMTSDDAPDDVG